MSPVTYMATLRYRKRKQNQMSQNIVLRWKAMTEIDEISTKSKNYAKKEAK